MHKGMDTRQSLTPVFLVVFQDGPGRLGNDVCQGGLALLDFCSRFKSDLGTLPKLCLWVAGADVNDQFDGGSFSVILDRVVLPRSSHEVRRDS